MNKDKTNIIIRALILAQCLSFWQIYELNNELDIAYISMNGNQSYVNERVENVYDYVNRELEKKINIIKNSSYKVGELDLETLEVPVTFTVEPYAVTEGTEVLLVFEYEMFPLTKNGSVFSGEKAFDLSSDYIHPQISIRENGVYNLVQDEGVAVDKLVDSVFPAVEFDYLGQTGAGKKFGTNEYEYSLYGNLYVSYKSEADSFISADFVTYIDGVEVERKDVSGLLLDQLSEVEIESSYILEEGTLIESFVEAEDSNGFMYRYLIQEFLAEDNSTRANYQGAKAITAPDGAIVFDNITGR